MNTMPDNEVVVLDLAGRVAAIVCRNPMIEPALRGFGFMAVSTRMERAITDNADREQLADALAELDVLFAEGKRWSPAELIRLYSERTILSAAYRTTSWLGPSEFRITATRFTPSRR